MNSPYLNINMKLIIYNYYNCKTSCCPLFFCIPVIFSENLNFFSLIRTAPFVHAKS